MAAHIKLITKPVIAPNNEIKSSLFFFLSVSFSLYVFIARNTHIVAISITTAGKSNL